MTKFNIQAYSEYERQKKRMDLITQRIADKLMEATPEMALRVLSKQRPIWTVDAPFVEGQYHLVSLQLTPSKELFRRVGIPGEESKTDDIMFIGEVNLLEIMTMKWFVEAKDYYDDVGKTGKTMTAGELFDSVTEEPGEGTDFIRIPNEHGVFKKVYPGSVIHIPTLDPGNRGNVFVIVKAITDADTIGCYLLVHTNGKSRVQYTQVKRSVVKDEWRWHREPDKQEAGIVGLDYVEMDGIQVREGMQVFIRGDSFKSSLENDLYRVSDQWADVEDLVSEEEALVRIRVQTPHGLQNMFEAVHGAYVEGIRDKAEKEEE